MNSLCVCDRSTPRTRPASAPAAKTMRVSNSRRRSGRRSHRRSSHRSHRRSHRRSSRRSRRGSRRRSHRRSGRWPRHRYRPHSSRWPRHRYRPHSSRWLRHRYWLPHRPRRSHPARPTPISSSSTSQAMFQCPTRKHSVGHALYRNAGPAFRSATTDLLDQPSRARRGGLFPRECTCTARTRASDVALSKGRDMLIVLAISTRRLWLRPTTSESGLHASPVPVEMAGWERNFLALNGRAPPSEANNLNIVHINDRHQICVPCIACTFSVAFCRTSPSAQV
jgi:hypothetical protein